MLKWLFMIEDLKIINQIRLVGVVSISLDPEAERGILRDMLTIMSGHSVWLN